MKCNSCNCLSLDELIEHTRTFFRLVDHYFLFSLSIKFLIAGNHLEMIVYHKTTAVEQEDQQQKSNHECSVLFVSFVPSLHYCIIRFCPKSLQIIMVCLFKLEDAQFYTLHSWSVNLNGTFELCLFCTLDERLEPK
jgi:hypothetical protein